MKDQMLARNYADIHKLPEAQFQQIVAGTRRLLFVCNALATVSAANNKHHMREINEKVIRIVMNFVKKLTITMWKRVLGAPPPPNAGVLAAQVIVCGMILPQIAPAQWGPATAGPNAALVPQNAHPANNPQPGPTNSAHDLAQFRPIPQTNVPATSRWITPSAAKAAHQTNTHGMPVQIASPGRNRLTQSEPSDQMNLFRLLAQIARSALPGHSLAQPRHAHPTSTHSTPSMTSLFGTSPPGNTSMESGSANPTNTRTRLTCYHYSYLHYQGIALENLNLLTH